MNTPNSNLNTNTVLQIILEHMNLFEGMIQDLQNQINKIRTVESTLTIISVITSALLNTLIDSAYIKFKKHSDLPIFNRE
jgi:hypothetical protein